jgi:hypothetical protein
MYKTSIDQLKLKQKMYKTVITAQPVVNKKGFNVSASIKVQSNVMEPGVKYEITIKPINK